MLRKVALAAVIILFLAVTYNLGRQIYQSLGVDSRLKMETDSLLQLQKKNSELKKKLAEVGSMEFVERQARDKLNLSRPNETIMIIPEGEINKVLGAEIIKKIEEIPNWLGWLRLFWK